jgi:threonylcarbamoyladenosine tRNA methylthiotransferase MtaB
VSGPEIVTLGCRLNAVESEAMRALAADRDDLVIVNSCAVTNAAVKQARQAIRQAARRRPDARIVVTGCAAQLDPAAFAAMPEVTAVIGNAEKLLAESFARVPSVQPLSPSPQRRLGSPSPARAADDHEIPAFAGMTTVGVNTARARAFIEVQNGCDHRCTFCIIPFARGPSRSMPPAAVIERVAALVAQGYREIVLTGVDTTSYGPDLPGAPTLGRLVERILREVPALERLRLSSLDSVEIDDRLFALLTQEPRMQPHLHLSLQHGDDLILKRMKRRHTRGQAIALVERLKATRPDMAIGADLIAGFPTETEAAARNTLALLDDCDVVFGHIFPFSPRTGTPAARMPQLDPTLVAARAKRLREAADARRARWLATLIGTEQAILVERTDGRGHVDSFASARITRPVPRGTIARMRVTHVEGDTLVGDPV